MMGAVDVMAVGAPAPQLDDFTKLLSVLADPKKTAKAVVELKVRQEAAEMAEQKLAALRETLSVRETKLSKATAELENAQSVLAADKARLTEREDRLRTREQAVTAQESGFDVVARAREGELAQRGVALSSQSADLDLRARQLTASLTASLATAQRDAEAAAALRREYETKLAKLRELME